MTAPFVQLEGVAKFGPTALSLTDFSDQISKCIIHYRRNTVTVPPTLANAQESPRAGSKSEELEIDFISDMTQAGFWAELWDALDTADSILYFEVHPDTQVQSTNHPSFTGQIIVTETMAGGTVGEVRTGSVTFPIVAGSLQRLDPS